DPARRHRTGRIRGTSCRNREVRHRCPCRHAIKITGEDRGPSVCGETVWAWKNGFRDAGPLWPSGLSNGRRRHVFSIEHLHALRTAEIDKIVTFFRPGARVLEIGAGTGHQALDLFKRGIDITAIEIPDSNYAQARLFSITDYDGSHIPFEDRSFDVV